MGQKKKSLGIYRGIPKGIITGKLTGSPIVSYFGFDFDPHI